MNEQVDIATLTLDSLPEEFSSGSTVLVASVGEPTQYAACLQILATCASADDTALVITTTESASRTADVARRLGGEAGHPSLGIVDTTSEQQSVSALYNETAVVFTPSPGDLERLVVGLSELAGNAAPASGARHLVVRSLTPILEASSASRVGAVLERITGVRSEHGYGLLGIDYTAHDEPTMAAIADRVDGILWVTRPSPTRLSFEYQSSRSLGTRFVPGGAGD